MKGSSIMFFGIQPVSRRSVTKGAAWAVPAVTVAGAAPALAASSTCSGGSQTLSHSEPGRMYFYEDRDFAPATATLTVTVPTCVHVGDVIVPQVSMSVTAAEFEAHYSGRGLVGNVRFWYGLTPGTPRGQLNVTDGIVAYRDADGHLGPMAAGQGASLVVTGPGDITVSTLNALVDTFVGDWENDYTATVGMTPVTLGVITVLP